MPDPWLFGSLLLLILRRQCKCLQVCHSSLLLLPWLKRDSCVLSRRLLLLLLLKSTITTQILPRLVTRRRSSCHPASLP
jgi:hypothetical protein